MECTNCSQYPSEKTLFCDNYHTFCKYCYSEFEKAVNLCHQIISDDKDLEDYELHVIRKRNDWKFSNYILKAESEIRFFLIHRANFIYDNNSYFEISFEIVEIFETLGLVDFQNEKYKSDDFISDKCVRYEVFDVDLNFLI